jgi:hypothetical protein
VFHFSESIKKKMFAKLQKKSLPLTNERQNVTINADNLQKISPVVLLGNIYFDNYLFFYKKVFYFPKNVLPLQRNIYQKKLNMFFMNNNAYTCIKSKFIVKLH